MSSVINHLLVKFICWFNAALSGRPRRGHALECLYPRSPRIEPLITQRRDSDRAKRGRNKMITGLNSIARARCCSWPTYPAQCCLKESAVQIRCIILLVPSLVDLKENLLMVIPFLPNFNLFYRFLGKSDI